MAGVASADATQQRAADPGASVWVSASAGTGKTKILTDRVLNLLLAGTAPGKILCITFTRAAAAEMSARLAQRLAAWTTMDASRLTGELAELLGRQPAQAELTTARRLFARVLDAPGGMKIQTFHAFCQSVLRRFPLEAGVVPQFSLLDEAVAAERLAAARDRVMAACRAGEDEGLAAALHLLSVQAGEQGFAKLLKAILASRVRIAALVRTLGGIDALIAAMRARLGADGQADAATVLKAATQDSAIDADNLRRAARWLLGGSTTDIDRASMIGRWLKAPDRRVETWPRYRAAFLTNESTVRKTLMTAGLARKVPDLAAVLRAEAERVLQVEEERKSQEIAAGTEAALRLCWAVIDRYDRDKIRDGLLDYDDLVARAGNLLAEPDIAPWVLFKLDGGIDHILIDEAQDTNPGQWQVIQTLAEEFFAGEGRHEEDHATDRTIFAVGDFKQSIFSFQGADPESFTAMRRHFRERVTAAEQNWRQVGLNLSFRSTAPVLAAVDATFANPAVAEGVIDPEAAADDGPPAHRPHRQGEAGLVEVWPLAVPWREEDSRGSWELPVRRRAAIQPREALAAAIASRIREWLDRGEMLEAAGRPIRAGDVMILVRQRAPLVEPLVRALKRRDIAVAGIDRMALTDQLAVMDLLAFARVLLLPEDDLTLATVLKSPLIGFDEDALYDLAHDRRERQLWRELRRRADERADFGRAHRFLADWLARVDHTPPYELFAELLAQGGRARIAARLGQEALDPLNELLSQALTYERQHVPSLQGFLAWLDSSEVEVKRDLDVAAADQVRIMTVHGSKGLEAPIVFLPDTTRVPTGRGEPLLWVAAAEGDATPALPVWSPRKEADNRPAAAAREAAAQHRDREYRRLLYVAMTRARDRLYVCGWQGRTRPPAGNWHQLVRAGMEKAGAETVTAEWGPKIHRLVAPQTVAVAPPADAAPVPAPAPLPAALTRPPAAEPPQPRPLTPSRPAGEEPPVHSPRQSGQEDRFRRGLLIHRLLQTLPDTPPARRAAACEAFLARRVHGLAAAEQAAIAAEVMRVLEDPGFAAIFGPGSRAETAVAGTVGAGAASVAIAGQIDRLAVTDKAVWIVDYKTNRQPPARPEQVPALYLRQMAAYRALLAPLYPDRAVTCALLWTDGPHLMPLDDSLLTPYAPTGASPPTR